MSSAKKGARRWKEAEQKKYEVDDFEPTFFDLEIELLGGEDGEPLKETKYKIVLPNGDERKGTTDDQGLINEEALPAGQVKLYLNTDDRDNAQKAIADAKESEDRGDTAVV